MALVEADHHRVNTEHLLINLEVIHRPNTEFLLVSRAVYLPSTVLLATRSAVAAILTRDYPVSMVRQIKMAVEVAVSVVLVYLRNMVRHHQEIRSVLETLIDTTALVMQMVVTRDEKL